MSKIQSAIKFKKSHSKSDPRTQFGALCYRTDGNGKFQVLLVTGRKNGRWKLPKGWPTIGLTPAQSAQKEAYEEAGVVGTRHEQCIGHYVCAKSAIGGAGFPCIVAVFPLKCDKSAKKFPEAGQRKLVWLTPKKAARRVAEPTLKAILKRFDPERLMN